MLEGGDLPRGAGGGLEFSHRPTNETCCDQATPTADRDATPQNPVIPAKAGSQAIAAVQADGALSRFAELEDERSVTGYSQFNPRWDDLVDSLVRAYA